MEKNVLTITAPAEAVCTLYRGLPGHVNFKQAIDPEKAIPATARAEADGVATYTYAGLTPGLYHCAAVREGYNTLCQAILWTEEKAATGWEQPMALTPLAGGGYEAGYVMLNTREFIDRQLLSHKDAWGPDYAYLFQTPQFAPGRPGRHQQTTNEELLAFLDSLAQTCPYMHVYSLGKSPKYGYDMPLVVFTKENVAGKSLSDTAKRLRNNYKPTIQYTAQCHSLEPASGEGALAMMLALCGEYGKTVLDAVDLYIIPRINPDGAFEVTRTAPTTGEDMNRDYLRTNNQEIRKVIGAYNRFLPEVCIDGHERKHYVLKENTDTCHDIELQTGAGALNHPWDMTETTMKMAKAALAKGKSLGLRGQFYAGLASAAGGSAGSSYFGTRNSLSFLIETPGQVHLGMSFMERRVMSQFAAASALIDYTADHATEIWAQVRASRSFTAKKGVIFLEQDQMVLEHGKEETGYWCTPLLHVPTGQVAEESYKEPYTEHTVALRSRVRPTAYVIPKGLANDREIRRVTAIHGCKHHSLPRGGKVKLQQYVKTEGGIDLTEEQVVAFPEGAWVFFNAVPSTVLNVIMEPDFNAESGRKMSLYSMGLVEADGEGKLPIYRYCHTLKTYKLPQES